MKKITFLLALIGFSLSNMYAQHSVARDWNEELLDAIRIDFARPTVHARNLFHSSVVMYDSWALFDSQAETVFLGKDYQVACPSDEREALLDAALELDRRMKSIRQTGSVIGVERIAVMAALNLAHEVISSPKVDDSQEELLANIHQRIDAVLPS